MSNIFGRIKRDDFKFVIPVPGKSFKSRIGKKDRVLLLVLNKGYVEADNIQTCYYTTVFMCSHKSDFFVPIGNIEKVRLNDGRIVYRHRVYFKSFATFLRVMKELNGKVELDSKFEVTVNTLANVIEDIPILERYAKDLGTSIDLWLTNVFKILIYEACKRLDMVDLINLTEDVYRLPGKATGYLNRAPLLCGSYSVVSHTSSVFRVEDVSNDTLYDEDIFDKNIVGESKDILDYGYLDSNVQKDIREGVIKL